jgi:hypothetical protein
MSPRPEGEYNLKSLEVTGIFAEAKGTISKFLQRFCKDHKLPKQLLEDASRDLTRD